MKRFVPLFQFLVLGLLLTTMAACPAASGGNGDTTTGSCYNEFLGHEWLMCSYVDFSDVEHLISVGNTNITFTLDPVHQQCIQRYYLDRSLYGSTVWQYGPMSENTTNKTMLIKIPAGMTNIQQTNVPWTTNVFDVYLVWYYKMDDLYCRVTNVIQYNTNISNASDNSISTNIGPGGIYKSENLKVW